MFLEKHSSVVLRFILMLVLLVGLFGSGVVNQAFAAQGSDHQASLPNSGPQASSTWLRSNGVRANMATTTFLNLSILDDFNRADGPLGDNWGGVTSGYSIASNQMDISSGGNIYWQAASFGADQAAYVTLAHIDPNAGEINLILKGQSSNSIDPGQVSVLYSPLGQYIQVWTHVSTPEGWQQQGGSLPAVFVDGDQFGVIARGNGQIEVYKNGVLLGVRSLTAWGYYAQGGYIGMSNFDPGSTVLDDFGGGTVVDLPTFTPTAALPTSTGSAFPSTLMLDNFNRTDGLLGTNWSGVTDGYAISSSQLDVNSGGNIYWQGTYFGIDQEAYVTLTHIDPNASEINLVLKGQSNGSADPGQISVLYNPAGHYVQVWTHISTPLGWQQQGASVPVTFADGDQFGARARADGQIEIYKNGSLMGVRPVSTWGYYAQGGYIGLSNFDGGNTILDDFGGGTIAGSPTLTPTAIPCTDPASCSNVVNSVPALWRCNIAECTDGDWTGGVIAWPSWSAYSNNARTGNNSRTVYSPTGDTLYPYMGSWANGCKITSVTGVALIIEWQRGTDLWRSTFLSPGQSHTINLIAPENNVLIEAPDGLTDFSVSIENCVPQNIFGMSTSTPTNTLAPTFTPTPSATNTATRTPTNTPTPTFTSSPTLTNTATKTPTATFTPSQTPTKTATPTFTATATNTRTFTPTNTATNTPTKTLTPTFTPTRTPTRTNTPIVPTFTPTRTNTPAPSGNLKIQLRLSGTDDAQRSDFYYRVINTTTSAKSNISVRIYFNLDGSQPASKYVLEKWWDQSNVATVSGPTQASGSTYYFTVNYGAASLAAGGSWEYQTTLHLSDWSRNHSGTNDWWHTAGALPSAYTDWMNIPAYIGGSRAWGSEPGAGPTTTATPTKTSTPTVTPPYSYHPLYLSLSDNQTVGGVAAANEDILKFDGQNWSIFFDGSDVGVGVVDLSSFSLLDADSILMSFRSAVVVNGITVNPQDVVRFDATSLGTSTTGTFSMYFDGSDEGLTTTDESLDLIDRLSDGRLLLSTTGILSVLEGTANDEDVVAFTPSSLGNTTSGTWAMYLDGSDVGLADTDGEDVDAVDVTANGTIYLSTVGDFVVNGVSGANEDVFVCTPTSIGSTSACTFSSALYFDGSTWGLSATNVDAFNYLSPGP